MKRHMKRITAALLLTGIFCAPAIANTYTVTNTGDNSGIDPAVGANTGTLRQAIIDANANPGADIINFNIAAGPYKITQSANLPPITGQVTINGYSQPGASSGTISGRTILIELETPGAVAWGLKIEGGNTVVCGIAFTAHNTGAGGAASIYRTETPATATSNVWIWGNYFNTNAAGTTTTGGGGYGIAAFDNTRGSDSVSNLQNLLIRTNSDGTTDDIEGNLFSHPDPALTPTLAAANAEPIRLYNCDNFVIAGNTFGLKKDGVTALQTFNAAAGQNYGISMTNCTGFRIGTNGDGTADVFERNVFAGMRSAAIVVFANKAGGVYYNDGNTAYTNRPDGNNLIAGNYMGTDVNGTGTGTDLQNRLGIQLRGTRLNTVGSATNAAMRNVIVKSSGTAGIFISGENFNSADFVSEQNTVAGNYIGVLADGVTASGNTTGIRLNANGNITAGAVSTYKNTIDRNIIANSTARGIDVRPNATNPALVYDNTITQNSIYDNAGLGINLGSSSGDVAVTANDGAISALSGATANRLMDYGIITYASLFGTALTISGYVGSNTAGNSAFAGAVVELFIADNSPADQNGEVVTGDGLSRGHGEGKTYLGSFTADANGLFSGTLNVTGKGVSSGTLITTTATATSGSTSEFSHNVIVNNPLPLQLVSFDAQAAGCNAVLTWKTAGERNVNRFVTERSTNGTSYSVVGTTAAKNEPGGSVYEASYTQYNNHIFYRLKMEDNDGSYTYSPVVNLRTYCNEATISLVPNPANDYFTVAGLKANERVQVFNHMGQLVYTGIADNGWISVDIKRFAPGVYYVRVADAPGGGANLKLVKQ